MSTNEVSKDLNVIVTEHPNAIVSTTEKFSLKIVKPIDDKEVVVENVNMIQISKNMIESDFEIDKDDEKLKNHQNAMFKIDNDKKQFITTLKISDDAIVVLHDALSKYIAKDMNTKTL